MWFRGRRTARQQKQTRFVNSRTRPAGENSRGINRGIALCQIVLPRAVWRLHHTSKRIALAAISRGHAPGPAPVLRCGDSVSIGQYGFFSPKRSDVTKLFFATL